MPARQYSQCPQAPPSQATPTAAPIAGLETPGPCATTWPVISWPGMSGRALGGFQSPSTAWMSEWQTPQAATRMSTSPGPRAGDGDGLQDRALTVGGDDVRLHAGSPVVAPG